MGQANKEREYRASDYELTVWELTKGDRHNLGAVHITKGSLTEKTLDARRFLDDMRLLNHILEHINLGFERLNLDAEASHRDFDPLQAWSEVANTELKGLGPFLAPAYVRDLLCTVQASLENLRTYCPREMPVFFYGICLLLLLYKTEYGANGYHFDRKDAVVIGKIVEEHDKCARNPKNLCLNH